MLKNILQAHPQGPAGLGHINVGGSEGNHWGYLSRVASRGWCVA